MSANSVEVLELAERRVHETHPLAKSISPAGVHPSLEISGILSKICAHVNIWFLSKHVLIGKNSLKTALKEKNVKR